MTGDCAARSFPGSRRANASLTKQGRREDILSEKSSALPRYFDGFSGAGRRSERILEARAAASERRFHVVARNVRNRREMVAVADFDVSNRQNLRREYMLFKGGGGRGPLLKRCRAILRSIPPTSVQAERDFSVVKHLLGKHRARMKPSTLDNIFILRRFHRSGAKLID